MAETRPASSSKWGHAVDYLLGRNTLIGVASLMLLMISWFATWHGMRDFIVGVSTSPGQSQDLPGGLTFSNDLLVIIVVVALTFLMWLCLRETFGVGRRLADRLGRTTVTIVAMAVSGSSAVAVGLLFGAAPILTFAVGVIWGVTVVADSAQFSTAVSELAPPGTAGSALAIQTALGFLLTGVTIFAVGLLGPGDANGWRIAFGLLAIGPLVGIIAMARLRRRPEAVRMASGHR